ncbi:flavin reductase family protein [Roseivirga sp. BDSF3-8]|uniref:flavin reductase family protein n=1 Tax=Roseivirga sp. BDSF3-8 TaxID=3241598 RepID=UPI003531BEEA
MDKPQNKSTQASLALKKISYGFYIVTTKAPAEELSSRDKDYYAAGTVSWVSQISFDPPLVMVAIQKDSDLNETIQRSQSFAINIVGKAELNMLKAFSKGSDVEGEKINGYSFEEKETGSPILNDVPAFIECELNDAVTPEGDHMVFIGKVVNAKVRNEDAEPLMEWETDYHYGG